MRILWSECVIAYQRPTSTQVLFYVLTPIGHKSTVARWCAFRVTEIFFFFCMFSLDLWEFLEFLQCRIFLLVLIGNSKNPQVLVCGRFSVVSRAVASFCLKPAAAENLWSNIHPLLATCLWCARSCRLGLSGSRRPGQPCCGTFWEWRWSCRQNRGQRCHGAVWERNRAWAPSPGWWSEPVGRWISGE